MNKLKTEYHEVQKSDLLDLLMEEPDLLTEDKIENILMVAGFVPVIGEIADTVLIIRYLIKGEILFAGIMLIALVPTVGDVIAKPLIVALKGAKWALKAPKALLRFLESSPKTAKLYKSVMSKIGHPSITKFVEGFKRRFPKLGSKLEQSISEHKSVYQSLIQADKAALAAGGKYTPKFIKPLKGKFTADYLKRKGITNPNALQRAWASYRGKRGVRNYIVKNVVALKILGIINERDLEKAINNPQTAQQLLNDPTFNNVVENADSMNYGQSNTSPQPGSTNMSDDMIVNILKKFAAQYAA